MTGNKIMTAQTPGCINSPSVLAVLFAVMRAVMTAVLSANNYSNLETSF